MYKQVYANLYTKLETFFFKFKAIIILVKTLNLI